MTALFQRRQHQQIAVTFQKAMVDPAADSRDIRLAAWHFANMLAEDNPEFSRELFLQACEPGVDFRAWSIRSKAIKR